jgi:hypothetical protein
MPFAKDKGMIEKRKAKAKGVTEFYLIGQRLTLVVMVTS